MVAASGPISVAKICEGRTLLLRMALAWTLLPSASVQEGVVIRLYCVWMHLMYCVECCATGCEAFPLMLDGGLMERKTHRSATRPLVLRKSPISIHSGMSANRAVLLGVPCVDLYHLGQKGSKGMGFSCFSWFAAG